MPYMTKVMQHKFQIWWLWVTHGPNCTLWTKGFIS